MAIRFLFGRPGKGPVSCKQRAKPPEKIIIESPCTSHEEYETDGSFEDMRRIILKLDASLHSFRTGYYERQDAIDRQEDKIKELIKEHQDEIIMLKERIADMADKYIRLLDAKIPAPVKDPT